MTWKFVDGLTRLLFLFCAAPTQVAVPSAYGARVRTKKAFWGLPAAIAQILLQTHESVQVTNILDEAATLALGFAERFFSKGPPFGPSTVGGRI